jgi:hypothetical protein
VIVISLSREDAEVLFWQTMASDVEDGTRTGQVYYELRKQLLLQMPELDQ